jgi:NodT family efflux transporter outer membrane factor (OMF) lipoprotein
MHDRRNIARSITPGILLVSALLLGGCQLVPPAKTAEEVQAISEAGGYHYGEGAEDTVPLEPAQWWRRIGGPHLEAQVHRLLRHSLELREARDRARQFTERAYQAGSRRLPSAGLELSASESRTADPFGEFQWSDAYAAGLSASFDPDLFGGLRTRHASAQLLAEAARLNYVATEHQVIAALAQSWVAAVTLERRLELAKATAESYRTTFELTDERYEAGSTHTSATDVLIARQNLDAALADIPAIDRQRVAQWISIDRQLAYLPGTTALTFEGDLEISLTMLAPVGLPASLLEARPDVAAAQLAYHAALQDIGAARADFLPGLSLAASLSFQNGDPADLFDAERYLAGLVASLTQPVFQGGRLRSELRLQQSEAEELATAYARTALTALAEVETALVQQKGLLDELRQLQQALRSAEKANDVAQLRYRQGLQPLLSVLEAQRALVSARQQILATEQSLLESRINLYLSLGGSWFEAVHGALNEPNPALSGPETP